MQSLDVISVNLWQILISLINLVLLFLIIKHFLFKPVKRMLALRQSEVDARYESAELAQKEAEASRTEWKNKLSDVEEEADTILQKAINNAKHRGEKMVAEAEERAEGIIHNAKTAAELEMRKAAEGIKREIVEVSATLTEKMLEREINSDDHRALIDSFIEKVGESHE